MSEYAKNIQRIEDMWKKRIELREVGCEQMSEYTRREMEYRAEQIAHEAQKRLARMEHIVDGLGDVKGEIVRCRDCEFADWDITAWWCTRDKHYPFEIGELRGYGERSHLDGFCAWGVKDGDAR